MSTTSSAVKRRYNAKNYDTISVMVPKGLKEPFKAACAARGDSMSGLVAKWVKAYIADNEEGQ